jgi:serine/threonine-protein phosphatase PGAM5
VVRCDVQLDRGAVELHAAALGFFSAREFMNEVVRGCGAGSVSATKTIILIRHGQYEDSEGGGVLTDLGRRQAARTGRRIGELKPHALYASVLTRARETADIIAQELGGMRVRVREDLREILPSAVPGYRVARAKQAAGRRQIAELCAAMLEPSLRTRTEVYVCHGNLIRAVVCQVLRCGPTRWLQLATAHCALTTLRVRGDGSVALASHNDVGHLPLDMQTVS